MCSARAPRAAAAAGLAVLLGGLAIPLLGPVLADEPAPFCCAGGRCCCAGDTAGGASDRACLRRGCGCERPDASVAGAPLQIEAVLPASRSLVTRPPSQAAWIATSERLLARAEAPPVPPPRRPLSA